MNSIITVKRGEAVPETRMGQPGPPKLGSFENERKWKKKIHVKMKLEEMKKLKSYYYWIFISWSWSKRPKSLFEVLSNVNLCYFPQLFYKKHFCDQCFRKLGTASYFSWIIGEWSEMNYPDTSRSVARSTVCIKWIVRLSSYLACILIMFNDVKRRYKLSK